MTALLDAVEALTKPTINHIAQKDDHGKWLRAHTVKSEPLLQQFADAVQPSSNRTTGSAATAATRAPIDLEAAFEFAKMASQIGDWCRMVGVPATRHPVEDLQRWYVARLTLRDVDDRFYIRALGSWAGIIRNHLDPPEKFVPEGLCPVCGGGSWGDAINGGDLWPIIVKYRLDDDDQMTDETALCRLCQIVWDGRDSIEELADEMNEKRA